MAASSGAMSDSDSSSGSSGSSDAEELARCREAARPAWGLEQRLPGAGTSGGGAAKSQPPASQPSLRHRVDEHEQDGNELQTTPEFRAHVAKKLGALLDSSITIAKVVREPRKTTVQREAPEDDGFRLFFTSIPGDTGKAAEPQPRRKRQPSSSSSEDSDEEWQRCQEAAVSASDILQESAIHSPVQQEEEEEEARKKKKKKKLKKKAQKVADVDSAVTTATTGAMVQKQEEGLGKANGAHAALGTKKKRKKKARKAHEAAPLSPAASPEATPAH
ncbi:protein CUSTOS isoform X5 [Ochotona princeps]|uniref:protein CUSTOS isoform X5 n=1 Tax=Ochotona princeps TaxID=9978 RepID=UPI0027146609|nr:protein CUSTOS isoform X5 [Ochotona princeps]